MKRRTLFLCAAAFQVAVLAGEYLSSVWPVWTGQRIVLDVVPVDPRSWFSGNYARLDYDIARLSRSLYRGSGGPLREGEVVYVALEPAGEVWRAAAVFLEQPSAGTFLRGRLVTSWHGESELWVRYGIEAWFAPKEEAEAIERSVFARRSGDIPVRAEVAVTGSGRAALVGLDWRP
jgi:uncharacterized membrane-anchored protein